MLETISLSAEASLIMQALNELSSPEEKLEALVRKYAELVRKQLKFLVLLAGSIYTASGTGSLKFIASTSPCVRRRPCGAAMCRG